MPDEPKTWLVAGLGNPGPEYEFTPHNLGFLALDRLAVRHGIRVVRPEAQALAGLGKIAGTPAVLVKPQTYMNRSGPSVRDLLARYELKVENLLLVYDELALPWNSLRIRPKGSSAGHNGVQSVIDSLGSNEFARIRVGIRPEHELSGNADFVLAPIKRAQRLELDSLLDTVCEAVESVVAEGVEKSMAKYNRRAQGLKEEE